MYRKFIKRLIDIVGSLILLVVLSPLFFICAILLAIANSGKVFFTQLRPGENEQIFKLVKFKTMNDKCDKSGQLLSDQMRLTPIGKVVRKLSIDEIPQLLNVLKGDMSLIGPRPLLVEYIPLYNDRQKRRHSVKPGITGWAQVNGRNSISWKEKFEYDIYYVDNLTFWLDFKIVFLTLFKIVKVEGISSETSVTMEKFTGEQ